MVDLSPDRPPCRDRRPAGPHTPRNRRGIVVLASPLLRRTIVAVVGGRAGEADRATGIGLVVLQLDDVARMRGNDHDALLRVVHDADVTGPGVAWLVIEVDEVTGLFLALRQVGSPPVLGVRQAGSRHASTL